MSKPIDLRSIAKANQWKLRTEEGSQHSAKSRYADPWLLIIPCVNGHLYCHSSTEIGVAVDGPVVAKRLKRLGFKVLQDGDDGTNFAVTADQLEDIAKHLRPRRQRVMSDEQRAACAERLAAYAIRPAR